MTTAEVLFQCLRHFAYMDEANAAMHTAEVRYSPITFRVAEAIVAEGSTHSQNSLVRKVMWDSGAYVEDFGR